MRKDKTFIIVLMDRSGSMSSIKNDMEGGLNEFVKEQKKLEGEVMFSLIQFDDTNPHEVVYDGVDIQKVEEITLKAMGCTPLLDAMGKTIVSIGEKLDSMIENEKPEKVLVMIITDGYENASKEYTKDKISEMIKHQEEKYSWEFMYLGANQDAISEGSSFGMNIDKTMTYAASKKGMTNMFNTVTDKVNNYRRYSMSVNFDDEDRSSAMEK